MLLGVICLCMCSNVLFGDACELANKIMSAQDKAACASEGRCGEETCNQWSLVQAMNRGLCSNPDFLVSKEEYERQSGVHIQAVSGLLPHITANFQGSEKQHSMIDFDRSSPGATAFATRSVSVGIDFRQNVFDGLSTLNKARSQLMSKQSAYWKMVDAGYILVAKVRSAYDNVLMRQNVVKALQESVKVFGNLEHMISRRMEVGEVTELDLVRVQAEHMNSKSRLAEAQAELKTAQEFFLTLLQIPFEECGELQLDGDLFAQELMISLDCAIERALAFQPILRSVELDVLASRLQLNAIIGTYFPKIDIIGRVSDNTSSYNDRNNYHGWQGFLVGTWDIFDGFEREGARKSARAALRATEVRRGEKCNEVVSQLRETYSRIQSFMQSIDTQYTVVDLRKREFSETSKFYEQGMIPFKDVLDAQRRLLDSQIELSLVIARSNASVYQFEYWMGLMPDSALPMMNCMVND